MKIVEVFNVLMYNYSDSPPIIVHKPNKRPMITDFALSSIGAIFRVPRYGLSVLGVAVVDFVDLDVGSDLLVLISCNDVM